MTLQHWTALRSVVLTATGLSAILKIGGVCSLSAVPTAVKMPPALPALNSLLESLIGEPAVVYKSTRTDELTKPHRRKMNADSHPTTATTPPVPYFKENIQRRNGVKSYSAVSSGISALPKTKKTRRKRGTLMSAPVLHDGTSVKEGPESPSRRITPSSFGGPDGSMPPELARHEEAVSDALTRIALNRNDLRTKRIDRKKAIYVDNEIEQRIHYQTKLLSIDEEYSLGMKVQFTVKCEEVHRGLATTLDRLPTFAEWATACGFEDESNVALLDERSLDYLRPVGSEEMFEETDPYFFVGNNIAQEAGPGRGCSLRDVPLRLQLGDWFDDSMYQAKLRAYERDKSLPKPPKEEGLPLNRGTVSDFVSLLKAGRGAKQRMIESNMRLVVSFAGKYCRSGVGLLDLIQEGSIGLHRAATKFEPKKGFKFSTYASWWIQQAVFRSIAYHSRSIRLPVHIHNMLNKVRKIQRNLATELMRKPTSEEVADRLGLSTRKYQYLIYLMKQTISLDSPAYVQNPRDSYFESLDLLSDTILISSEDDSRSAEKDIDQSLFLKDLNEMLTTLDQDELIVISLRYGLRNGFSHSVTNIAASLNQSKEWVRSKECRGLRKLRRPWYEKKLREYQEALDSS